MKKQQQINLLLELGYSARKINGLKTEKKRIVKAQASGLLAPTDWYVVKSSEVADYNVPENITKYRFEF